ncbi:hypothetical protein RIR_jg6566.t1 [Rhizophagus irregularis DAOM 181602=DAOM 197198]|nr:hypothetical protein RIR_jg6566.t1 [Rhizophagus irregularis DAOM 181602=DAOM 197198]
MLPSVKVFKDPNSGVSHPTTTLSFPTMLSRCRLILLRRVYFRNQFRNQFWKYLKYSSPTIKSAIGSAGGALEH